MRPAGPALWPLLLALACGPAPARTLPPDDVPPAPPAPPASTPPPTEADRLCAGVDPASDEPVRLRVEDVSLECTDGRLDRCRGEVRYAVANCGARPVELHTLRLADVGGPGRGVILIEPAEPRIAPRAVWSRTRAVFREEALRVHVDGVDADGVPLRVAEPVVRVANPAREAAMAACAACDGTWGIQGLQYRDACNCRARDAGRPCRAGDECEGACQFDRWEVSVPAEPLRCKGKRCSVRPAAIGRPLGRCSSHVALRSCHTLLQDGISDAPDQALPWGVRRVCID